MNITSTEMQLFRSSGCLRRLAVEYMDSAVVVLLNIQNANQMQPSVTRAIEIAASTGWVEGADELREPSNYDINGILSISARTGNNRVLRAATTWGMSKWTDWTAVMTSAANANNISGMRLIRSCSNNIIYATAYAVAVRRGSLFALKQLNRWTFNDRPIQESAYWHAGASNQIQVLKLLIRENDARSGNALCSAAANGHIKAMRVVRKFCAGSVNLALSYAAATGQIKCLKLLHKWGANKYADALRVAGLNGHTDVVKLLRSWAGDFFENTSTTYSGQTPKPQN